MGEAAFLLRGQDVTCFQGETLFLAAPSAAESSGVSRQGSELQAELWCLEAPSPVSVGTAISALLCSCLSALLQVGRCRAHSQKLLSALPCGCSCDSVVCLMP